MTIRIPILTGLLFSLFILTSWVQLDKSKNVFVSISATTSGVMQKGYGIIMTLINIDTKMSFKTKSLGGMSPHSIIEDLPLENILFLRLRFLWAALNTSINLSK